MSVPSGTQIIIWLLSYTALWCSLPRPFIRMFARSPKAGYMRFATVVPALAGQMGRFHRRKTDTYLCPQPHFHIELREAEKLLYFHVSHSQALDTESICLKGEGTCRRGEKDTQGQKWEEASCSVVGWWLSRSPSLCISWSQEPDSSTLCYYGREHIPQKKNGPESHCAFFFIFEHRHSRLTGCHWKRVSAMARVLSQDTFPSQSLGSTGEDRTAISDPRQQWDLPSVACRG